MRKVINFQNQQISALNSCIILANISKSNRPSFKERDKELERHENDYKKSSTLSHRTRFTIMVELKGIEPSTSSMPWRRSPN